jgi:hypothetical protein
MDMNRFAKIGWSITCDQLPEMVGKLKSWESGNKANFLTFQLTFCLSLCFQE